MASLRPRARAGAAVARYQRLGAMADSAALSTAAPNIKALPVRHDAALFAAIGRSDGGEAGSQVGRAGSSPRMASARPIGETIVGAEPEWSAVGAYGVRP